MRIRVELPRLGKEMESALVTSWSKQVGDRVSAGEPLVSVEANKADVEIPSPVSGVLVEITAPVDAEVAIGGVLCIIDDVA
jgi:pyruvate/2-oxoglutarate dehydrogenase complex dihydrolipoamide acyltransferase (E2) component